MFLEIIESRVLLAGDADANTGDAATIESNDSTEDLFHASATTPEEATTSSANWMIWLERAALLASSGVFTVIGGVSCLYLVIKQRGVLSSGFESIRRNELTSELDLETITKCTNALGAVSVGAFGSLVSMLLFISTFDTPER